MTTRKVEENTVADATDDASADNAEEAGDNVGSPVMADDPDPNDDDLTYTLSGPDASSFRVRGNGQIEVAAGTMLNFETKHTYMVTLKAEDSFGDYDTIDVTITIVDIDEPPMLSNKALAVVGEVRFDYPEAGTDAVGMYQIAGPDAARARLSLAGHDASRFSITSGELRFRSSPDYENPLDHDTNNVYEVTVRATYRTLSDERIVRITVINVDEDGAVTLSPCHGGQSGLRSRPR